MKVKAAIPARHLDCVQVVIIGQGTTVQQIDVFLNILSYIKVLYSMVCDFFENNVSRPAQIFTFFLSKRDCAITTETF